MKIRNLRAKSHKNFFDLELEKLYVVTTLTPMAVGPWYYEYGSSECSWGHYKSLLMSKVNGLIIAKGSIVSLECEILFIITSYFKLKLIARERIHSRPR